MISGQDKLIENFKSIFDVTSSKEFRNMEGLSGEVPFWIAPYDIQLQDAADEELAHLLSRLNNQGIEVLILDLFEISIQIIESNIGLEKIFQVEKKKIKINLRRHYSLL